MSSEATTRPYAVTPVAVSAFLAGLATIAVVLRAICRKLSGAGFWWDDWLMFIAWLIAIGGSLCTIVASFHGLGQHHGDLTFFLKILYFVNFLYNLGLCFSKVSVLFFYYRIFSADPRLRRALWITGAIFLACYISFQFECIFLCTPPRAYWDLEVKGSCRNNFEGFIAISVCNIIFDLVLLILPIRPVWHLSMARSRRVLIVIVFILGYFNPVISIIRLVALVRLGQNNPDFTYAFVPPTLWSIAEIVVVIFSSTIPSLGFILQWLTDKLALIRSSLKSLNSPRNPSLTQLPRPTALTDPSALNSNLKSAAGASYGGRPSMAGREGKEGGSFMRLGSKTSVGTSKGESEEDLEWRDTEMQGMEIHVQNDIMVHVERPPAATTGAADGFVL